MATEEDIDRYESDASGYWNKFYGIHENKFFKDRHWLFTEFPELAPESYLSPDKLSELSLRVNDKTVVETSTENGSVSSDVTVQRSEVPTDGGQVLAECPSSDLQDDNLQALSELSDKKTQGDSPKNVFNDNDSVVSSKTAEDSEGRDVSKHKKEKFPGEMAKYRMFEKLKANRMDPEETARMRRLIRIHAGRKHTSDPDLMVYCCDYSSTAVDLVKENKDYDSGRCHAFVCDISDPESSVPFPEGSLDIIILIFILSANNPERFQAILNRLASFLRPGGMILFRDYGRYDLAQLRFKKGKCLGENFYVRGDGTRAYFFTQDEIREMMTKAELVEKQNLVDRRLQVNRGKQLKMYRVWIQCKYMKPARNDNPDDDDR